MRVLGGSRRQLRRAQASEFAAIGLLSGLVAAIAASIPGYGHSIESGNLRNQARPPDDSQRSCKRSKLNITVIGSIGDSMKPCCR